MSKPNEIQQTTGMKKGDQAAYRREVLNGGLRGTAIGAGVGVPMHFILRRRPGYNAIPITLKALGYVVLVVPCISIAAEKAGEAYIRSTWSGVGKTELDREAQRARERWDALGEVDRAKDWAARNKWGLIAGAWAGSMGIAFALVARTPQTFSQKLVQARMWAQGLTVGTLLSSAFLGGTVTTENKVVEGHADHSWADVLESEGLMKKDDLERIRGKVQERRA